MSADESIQEAPSPVPVPPEFAFTWEDTDDERLFWKSDKMHFPELVTPMTVWFNRCFAEGTVRAAEACSIPIKLQDPCVNTYNFIGMSPRVPHEEMEAVGKASEESRGAMIDRLLESWGTELLPEIREHMAYWEDLDLHWPSMPDLLCHLDETSNRLTRLWDIHFLIGFPFLLAPSLFGGLYQDLFGEESVESGHALWDLSGHALESHEVCGILEGNDDVPDALERFAQGRAFPSSFCEYLAEFGKRSDIFCEMDALHWVEDPTMPTRNIQDGQTTEVAGDAGTVRIVPSA